MKKIILLTPALFLTLFIFNYNIFSQTNQTFTVTNKSGVTVTGLYVTPTGSNNWSTNIMNKDSAATGGTFEFTQTVDQSLGQGQNQNQNNCNFDLKFTTTEGKEYIMHNVNLCKAKTFAIFKTGDVMKSDIDDK